MKGLVKIAWTGKQFRAASKASDKYFKDHLSETQLTDKELIQIKDYIKEKEKLDIGILTMPIETGAYFPAHAAKNLKQLETDGKLVNDRSLDRIVAQKYNDEKDGFILSHNDRNILLHELGHAIDHNQNKRVPRMLSNRLQRQIGAPFALGGLVSSGHDHYSSNELDSNPEVISPIKSGLIGAGAGTLVAAPLSITGSLQKINEENAANRNGEQILRNTNTVQDSEKLLPLFRESSDLAKRTYTVNALRHLKIIPIAATLGATGGLGLAASVKRNANKEEADT